MKINKYVDQTELAGFLRELADAVENGGEGELACVNDFKKLKIAIKNEFGQINVKLKIKAADTCEEEGVEAPTAEAAEAGQAKPKYKHLKKRMKSSYKMIVKMIHDGEVPPAEAVESFLADSDLMVTYPGYGDEYYDDYITVCEAFKKAYESGDLAKMDEAIGAISHEKSRCHAKYD